MLWIMLRGWVRTERFVATAGLDEQALFLLALLGATLPGREAAVYLTVAWWLEPASSSTLEELHMSCIPGNMA